MTNGPLKEKLSTKMSGPVEADETYVGPLVYQVPPGPV
jgi:hypothetical protein